MSDDVRKRVIAVVAKISGISEDEIGESATFEEIDLDSLSRIEVLVDLEREFGLPSPEEGQDEQLVASITSIDDAVKYVLESSQAETAAAE